jgi:hypothetical protein
MIGTLGSSTTCGCSDGEDAASEGVLLHESTGEDEEDRSRVSRGSVVYELIWSCISRFRSRSAYL